jgi:hypothetical protein
LTDYELVVTVLDALAVNHDFVPVADVRKEFDADEDSNNRRLIHPASLFVRNRIRVTAGAIWSALVMGRWCGRSSRTL